MTKNVTNYEPKKVIQALIDPSWIETMHDELIQFKLQQVWILVDLPYSKRAIGTKWIYINKKDKEVFAPVARIEAIRLFLAFASLKDFVVYQIDVKSAFLYGKIKEEGMFVNLQGLKIQNSLTEFIRFQVTPKVSHLHAVKRIFRYLKGQPKLGLWYPKDLPFDLEAYTDSDYASASLDRKSITGEYVAAFNCYGQRKQKTKKPRKKDNELPQTSVPTEVVIDEAVYKGMYDNVERAATTATGLDAEVLTSETTKTNQALEIGSLKRRVKKIKKKDRKRNHKLKRLYKIGVTLIDGTHGRNDKDMFDTGVLDGEEVISKKEVSTADPVTTAGEVVTTAGVEVSATATTPTISMDDITLAKALTTFKSEKPMVKEPSIPKAKGIVMQEHEEITIRTTIAVPSQGSKDKGKAKMIKPEKPLKKKD
nr:hypothetical protein [Tanacetum cinerariifolium]